MNKDKRKQAVRNIQRVSKKQVQRASLIGSYQDSVINTQGWKLEFDSASKDKIIALVLRDSGSTRKTWSLEENFREVFFPGSLRAQILMEEEEGGQRRCRRTQTH